MISRKPASQDGGAGIKDAPQTTSDGPQLPAPASGEKTATISAQLLTSARSDDATVLQNLGSRVEGLSPAEAAARLKEVGPNEIAREKRQSPSGRLLDNVKNPLSHPARLRWACSRS